MIVKELREKLGLTREAFARELNVSSSSIWKWEQGRRPSRLAQEKIDKLQKKVERMGK